MPPPLLSITYKCGNTKSCSIFNVISLRFSDFLFSIHPQQFLEGLPWRGCDDVLHVQTRQAFDDLQLANVVLDCMQMNLPYL